MNSSGNTATLAQVRRGLGEDSRVATCRPVIRYALTRKQRVGRLLLDVHPESIIQASRRSCSVETACQSVRADGELSCWTRLARTAPITEGRAWGLSRSLWFQTSISGRGSGGRVQASSTVEVEALDEKSLPIPTGVMAEERTSRATSRWISPQAWTRQDHQRPRPLSRRTEGSQILVPH